VDVPHGVAAAHLTMDEARLAEYVAQHAVLLLLAVTAGLLLFTVLLWASIQRWMPRVFARAAGLWRHVDRRGLAARYLGLHAVVAALLAAAGLVVFLELADEIGVDEELALFDSALAEALSQSLSPAVLQGFAWISHLGDPAVLFPLGGVVAVVLFLRREVALACSWIVGTLGCAALNSSLKLFFSRARPERLHDFAHVDGFSFPSGHASGSMAVYGLLTYFVVRHTPRAWHVPCVVAAMLTIVFVGASRVLLQVHYFSDVLAGWTVAGTWTALCIAGLEAARLGARRRVPASA
jgi:membrane-associated phospholipid phosphatase